MKKIFSILSLLAVILPTMAFAAEFRASESATVSEPVRNLYVAGQSVNVNSNIQGDLVAAGSTVNVSGNVEKSAHIAGSNVNLRGTIGDNVRVASGNVVIDGNVGEDVIVFGGQVTIGKNVIINRDLIVFGGYVTLDGRVNGKVVGSMGEITINGTVAGDVDLKDVEKVTLGDDAKINGKLVYASRTESNIDRAKVAGGVEFNKFTRSERGNGTGALFGMAIFGIVGGFILLYVLTRITPRTSRALLETAIANPWANIGIGFVALTVIPMALVALLITVFGAPLAGVGFVLYIAMLVLAGVFTSLAIGSWLVKVFNKREELEINWLTVLVGVVAVALLKFIPIVGWFIGFILFLLSLGSLVRHTFATLKAEQATK